MGPGSALAMLACPGRREFCTRGRFKFSNSRSNFTYDSAISRREAPEFCKKPSAQRKQRAQGKPGARCTRSLACEIKIAHERSHHRFRRIQPGLPRAMVLTAYFALSPATRLCCHRRLRIWYAKTRLGLRTSARLDASIGASEPHDFTVR